MFHVYYYVILWNLTFIFSGAHKLVFGVIKDN